MNRSHTAGLTVCSVADFKDGSLSLPYVACGLLVFEAGDVLLESVFVSWFDVDHGRFSCVLF